MKKLLSLVLSSILALSFLTACSSDTPQDSSQINPNSQSESSSVVDAEGVDIRIAGMKGPTSMGLVSLLDKSEKGESKNNYTFTLAGAPDEITPKLVKGELDIAAVPANLASILYNNTNGKIKVLAVNTLGVLYIVEQGETVKNFADLKGKTIYSTGKGTTPEYALKYLLAQNGLDPEKDVTFEWKNEATEIVAVLKNDPTAIAMLPQPYVTVAQTQIEGLKSSISLNDEWNKLNNGSMLVTGVVVVRDEFAKENPEQIAMFLDEYKNSIDYVNSNTDEASALIEQFDIFKGPVAKKALPYCNISFMEGSEMKSAVSGYLKTLFEQNPKSIGEKMPADDFYYQR